MVGGVDKSMDIVQSTAEAARRLRAKGEATSDASLPHEIVGSVRRIAIQKKRRYVGGDYAAQKNGGRAGRLLNPADVSMRAFRSFPFGGFVPRVVVAGSVPRSSFTRIHQQ